MGAEKKLHQCLWQWRKGPWLFSAPRFAVICHSSIRNQNPFTCSLRTLLRKTPRFPHLFYFLEVSINEVSCFSRIPVFPVVFNHTSNKHFQFLPVTKEFLVGTRKEIYYPWKDIVELIEKTKQSSGQGGETVFHFLSLFFTYTWPLASSLTHLLCLNPLLSPLAKRFSPSFKI